MKAVLGAITIIVVLVLIGWITFGSTENETSINLETEKIKGDVGRMEDKTRDLVDSVERSIDEEADEKQNIGEETAPVNNP